MSTTAARSGGTADEPFVSLREFHRTPGHLRTPLGGEVTNGPIEPNADARQFAGFCFQIFTALMLEGFNEQQALVIIGQMIAANANGGGS